MLARCVAEDKEQREGRKDEKKKEKKKGTAQYSPHAHVRCIGVVLEPRARVLARLDAPVVGDGATDRHLGYFLEFRVLGQRQFDPVVVSALAWLVQCGCSGSYAASAASYLGPACRFVLASPGRRRLGIRLGSCRCAMARVSRRVLGHLDVALFIAVDVAGDEVLLSSGRRQSRFLRLDSGLADELDYVLHLGA